MEGITLDTLPDPPERRASSASGIEQLFERALAEFGPAISRIARANEANAARRADLQQEIYFELWRSLAVFDGRCSLGTWVYRVALNMAARHLHRQRRVALRELQNLEEIAEPSAPHETDGAVDDEQRLALLNELIARLKPLDRQVVLLYLDDLDAAQIGEITGLSASHVAVKVHRVKRLLAQMYAGTHHE
jgi:RNA polymerase sigma-70 factor (ECF subfamily)